MPQGTSLLLSGAADHTVRVWAVTTPTSINTSPQGPNGGGTTASPTPTAASPTPWHCLAVLEGHTAPVSSLACYPLPLGEKGFLVVSTAGDPNVHIWRCTPSSQPRQPAPPTTSPDVDSISGNPALASAASIYGQSSWALHQTLPVGTHIQQVWTKSGWMCEDVWICGLDQRMGRISAWQ